MIGFLAGLRVEKVAGIGSGALSKPPAASVEFVGATFQHHVYNGAAVIAEFGGEAVVLNLELLNDLHRRLVINVAGRAFSLFRRADQCAVQSYFRRRVSLAIRNEISSSRIIVLRAGAGNFRHTSG